VELTNSHLITGMLTDKICSRHLKQPCQQTQMEPATVSGYVGPAYPRPIFGYLMLRSAHSKGR
jgi:hypothetical protein